MGVVFRARDLRLNRLLRDFAFAPVRDVLGLSK
jgi:hypothetical protein